MKICILGAKGNIKPEAEGYKLHSGVLIDDMLLLDLGERLYLQYDPECIFITHLHDDHAFFVKDDFALGQKVYAPEVWPGVVVAQGPILCGEYTITPLPIIHSNRVKSLAYLIKHDETNIFYTGDVAELPEATLTELPQKLDAVITEASFGRKKGLVRTDTQTGRAFGHTGLPDLIDIFQSYTKKIILTHFGSWFVRDPVAGKRVISNLAPPGTEIYIASDGKCFNI